MFSTKLLAWFRKARRELPWRREPRDPYRVWVSEVMLQQTRVDVVIPYYQRFLRRFPTLRALAAAPLDDVLALWSGLGYYSRARNLHKAAQACANGELPRSAAALRELPGFGPYTAAAVASLAFGEDVPLVDGNVARVLSRVFRLQTRAEAWRKAAELLPPGRAGEFNEALMELGATVCTPRQPGCSTCAIRTICTGRAEPHLYPPPKPKKPRPLLEWRALALRRKDGAVLLERQPEGLFAGMWDLPRAAPKGIRLNGPPAEKGVVEQTLTHREVRVHVAAAPASGTPRSANARWVRPADLGRYGLSSLARKSLKQGGMA
ncbi:MAG TPA: A/G-specific adenine glycosylase [Myxococcales bacterium]|nr:A/G-specific adenine glycosylase [Myxococcales bacterium]